MKNPILLNVVNTMEEMLIFRLLCNRNKSYNIIISLCILTMMCSCDKFGWNEYMVITSNEHPDRIALLEYELNEVAVDCSVYKLDNETVNSVEFEWDNNGIIYNIVPGGHITTGTLKYFNFTLEDAKNIIVQVWSPPNAFIYYYDLVGYNDKYNKYLESSGRIIDGEEFIKILKTKPVSKQQFAEMSKDEAIEYLSNCIMKIDFCFLGDGIYFCQTEDKYLIVSLNYIDVNLTSGMGFLFYDDVRYRVHFGIDETEDKLTPEKRIEIISNLMNEFICCFRNAEQ
jgi:hypothetical protein